MATRRESIIGSCSSVSATGESRSAHKNQDVTRILKYPNDCLFVSYSFVNNTNNILNMHSSFLFINRHHHQAWICLGISIVILVPVLSFLAGFYHRYMQQSENGTALLYDSRIIRRSIISFFSLLHNASFLLSHITNQGVSITTLFYYWMIVLGPSFESKMMMTLHYKTHIRLSLQSAPEVSQQLHLGRSLVSDGCRLGQRLRRSPLFISVRLKTATRP